MSLGVFSADSLVNLDYFDTGKGGLNFETKKLRKKLWIKSRPKMILRRQKLRRLRRNQIRSLKPFKLNVHII